MKEITEMLLNYRERHHLGNLRIILYGDCSGKVECIGYQLISNTILIFNSEEEFLEKIKQ